MHSSLKKGKKDSWGERGTLNCAFVETCSIPGSADYGSVGMLHI